MNAVGWADLDLVEPGGDQGRAKFGFGECTGDTSGPCGHVGFGVLVHVGVGDHVRDRESPPGRSTRALRLMTWGLSPERLITQLEITTSTLAS